jgi:hypothetical protein
MEGDTVRRIWRSPEVRAFLRELSPEEREAFHEHELVIYRDPQPDFQTRFRLPAGEIAYYVYYGPLFDLVYRLDPPDEGGGLRPRRQPNDFDDILMITTARLAEDDEAA